MDKRERVGKREGELLQEDRPCTAKVVGRRHDYKMGRTTKVGEWIRKRHVVSAQVGFPEISSS